MERVICSTTHMLLFSLGLSSTDYTQAIFQNNAFSVRFELFNF